MFLSNLFNFKKKCSHDKISINADSAYCPDCGKLVHNEWYLTRCSCCGIKLKTTITNDKIRPFNHYKLRIWRVWNRKAFTNKFYWHKFRCLKTQSRWPRFIKYSDYIPVLARKNVRATKIASAIPMISAIIPTGIAYLNFFIPIEPK